MFLIVQNLLLILAVYIMVMKIIKESQDSGIVHYISWTDIVNLK